MLSDLLMDHRTPRHTRSPSRSLWGHTVLLYLTGSSQANSICSKFAKSVYMHTDKQGAEDWASCPTQVSPHSSGLLLVPRPFLYWCTDGGPELCWGPCMHLCCGELCGHLTSSGSCTALCPRLSGRAHLRQNRTRPEVTKGSQVG